MTTLLFCPAVASRSCPPLTRLFKKHLRATPASYWRRMRLKAAHWMVQNSSRSLTQIAYECGFTDSSHMIHWFKR